MNRRILRRVRHIFNIRATGFTSMFDMKAMQVLANERQYYELVVFIEEHSWEYVHFILSGKIEGVTTDGVKACELIPGTHVIHDEMPENPNPIKADTLLHRQVCAIATQVKIRTMWSS